MVRQIVIVTLATIAVAALMMECFVRISGVADVPLYEADDRIGYIPKPDQSETLFLKSHWDFNDKSMGISRPFAGDPERDILLVGDSIVMGTNKYYQEDRLGPQLENIVKVPVWPIGASSWSVQNEIEYLKRFPDVAGSVARIVFIFNVFDFQDDPSSWRNPISHPLERQWSLVWFLAEKYLLKPAFDQDEVLRVQRRDWLDDLSLIAQALDKPIDLFLYPTREEISIGKPCFTLPDRLSKVPNITIHCIGKDPRWSVADYEDDIHPLANSTPKLAQIIADNIPLGIFVEQQVGQ
ncbi:hypothetical protein FHS85_002933 [Rhodoligotrophos appendicifer]|uniref:hypothetical protein n=1 Tax=Rhodoligotrophos appendicifer TaxID=987056 RepID=UPI00118698E8|nr:hypothetical protein [Rhodoligotrophos appendicifer]